MNKKMLKKLLVSILIVLLVGNLFVNNVVLADTARTGFFDVLGDFLGVAFGSVVGLLTYPFRLLALGLSNALDGLTAGIAYSQGTVNEYGVIDPYGSASSITPFDIFFNKLALLDVNFFNIPTGESIVRNMRLAIAGWYYVMRNIAASILLCVLIYVGIRMAISTVASDKAAFKKMLVDWVCSLALIFLIQYIIIFTFAVNEALINALRTVGEENATAIIDAMEAIKKTAKNLVTLDSIPATIVYCMLVGQTLSLVFSYFNRMLKIAFLVIISPLITLTYSIDKMGDGKAQALGTWLKEFVYTVLLQVFHCVIYMVFVGMAVSILNSGVLESYNLVGSFLAVMCVKFTKDAEKLLGKIFKFGDSTSDASIAVGMALSAAAFQKAGSIGKGAVKGVNSAKSFVNQMGGLRHNAKVAFASMAAIRAGQKNGEKLSYADVREEAEAKVLEKETEKAQKKNEKKYGVNVESENYKKAINEEKEKLRNDHPEMSENMLNARAKANVAANTRATKKEEKKPRVIKAVSGEIKNMQAIAREFRSTEFYKTMSGVTKGYLAGGAALFAGAAMYGVQGDAFKAFALGGGAFKGTQEALKSSSKTLVDDASSILDGLGAENKDDAAREMQKTHEMSPILSDNNELQKHLDKLLDFVNERLQAAGIDPNGKEAERIRTSVKNTVAQQVKKNPSIKDDDLLKRVKDNLNQDPKISDKARDLVINGDGSKGSENVFGDALKDVANTQRRKNLYDVMQNANDLNLSPEAFTHMVQKRYESGGTSTYKTNEQVKDGVMEGTGPASQGDLDDRTEEAREELRKEFEAEYEKYKDQGLGNMERDLAESIARTYDSDVRELKRERDAEKDVVKQDYNRAVDEIEKRAERELAEARRSVENLAREDAIREFTKAKAEIETNLLNAKSDMRREHFQTLREINAKYKDSILEASASRKEWRGKATPPAENS